MKKKLFLALVIATLFVCIFAISVSAAVTGSTSNEYGEIEYVEGIDTVKGYDTTSRAVLVNADGTYTTYPAYYIYNGSTGTNMDLNFSKLNGIVGENYKESSLIRVEVFAGSRLNWTYSGCSSLIDVYLPEGVYLHYASFSGCSSLETITLPSTGVTQIPTECFNGCYKLKSINIPNTVTTLGAKAFQNCLSLSEIKFPEGYTGIIPQDFRKITVFNQPCTPVTYVIPKGCTGINSQYSINNCNVAAILFTGTSDSAFVKDVANDCASWATKITYVNHCDVYFNSVHNPVSEEGNNCCGVCERCGKLEMLEIPKHNSEWIFNGGEDVSFVAEITAEHVCKWCKTVENAETIAIIVSTDGYSTEDNGTGVYQLTKVNKVALSRYAELSEQTFDYGIFAGIAAEDEGTPLTLDENGIATAVDTKNTVFASFEGTQYTYLQIKVTGLDKDASIYCGAYLVIGEDIIYLADKKVGTTVSKFVPTIA